MFVIDRLSIAHGKIPAVRDLSLQVDHGEIVAMIGPNGAGKSSTLNAIAGVGGTVTAGSVEFEASTLLGLRPEDIVRRGVALVPEGRHIFATLSVAENLQLGLTTRRRDPAAAADLEAALDLFPVLRRYYQQSAGTLSGGEQQQLAIARAILSKPRLLLLDEPSLGLAPLVIEQVLASIVALREQGLTVLLVEQNSALAMQIADRVYVMRTGQLAFSGKPDDFAASDIAAEYFG